MNVRPRTRSWLRLAVFAVLCLLTISKSLPAQNPRSFSRDVAVRKLHDIYMRDPCILADEATRTYYIVASGFNGVRGYTSPNLIDWEGPHILFETPHDHWGEGVNVRGVWAPEIHKYRDKYYLFATFDSSAAFPEQWRNWLPRVRRGSQVLHSDKPMGTYQPFAKEATLPRDMMTLDGTLWIEDEKPYMVYCHEWVQIVNGSVEMIQLKDDLSATVGEPRKLFFASDAKWVQPNRQYGSFVTDGVYLHRSTSGKLFMPWSSFSATGYTVGLAISDSGKLAGPWRQQEKPLYTENGGHSMLFKRFDGQLMMLLHAPNNSANSRARLFEVEDTGETLNLTKPFATE